MSRCPAAQRKIANFRSGVFAVVLSDWTGSGTAPVTLQVSPEADPASEAWVDLETFTPPNSNATLVSQSLTLFGQQARLKFERTDDTASYRVAATAMLRS